MLARKLAEYERREIESALELHGWNKMLAARFLGISRPTLYRKIARYGIECNTFEIPSSSCAARSDVAADQSQN